MLKFPKIETLFERGDDHKLIEPLVFKNPAHEIISRWVVTEKLDGMNMRVGLKYGDEKIQIAGRSDNAQIHPELTDWIQTNITVDKFTALFNDDTEPGTEMVLFGEGFGAGIQKGAYYSAEKRFRLFDVAICCPDTHWLDNKTVFDFSVRLGIRFVPTLSMRGDMDYIVKLVRGGFNTIATDTDMEPHTAEGIVARPIVPLFDARGSRIIIKLKTKDFRE